MMKKKWLITLICITCIVLSCSEDVDDKKSYTVTFYTDGGTPVPDPQQVDAGNTITIPSVIPVKAGYVFAFWHLIDETSAYNFQVPVNKDITLYAKWTTNNEEPGNNHPPTTLYIVGKDDYAACLWKVDLATDNIIKVSLNSYGEANGIVVSNGNVYISGIKTNTSSKKQACYWKNGEATLLTNAGNHFEATAIAVSGNDIYVTGDDHTGSGSKPCYWKNGTLAYLSSSAQYAWTTDIFVSGNDVYVSGGNDSNDPCYWKNGIKTSLSRQNYSQAETQAAIVSGADIYVAGRIRYPGNWRACYWKNNTLVVLTEGTSTAQANAIKVHNGKVYVAGTENTETGTMYTACYWVDGTKITLEEWTLASAQDIGIAGSNVYAVGSIWISGSNGSGNYKACYWKNGIRVDLGDGKKTSEAFAIALSWE